MEGTYQPIRKRFVRGMDGHPILLVGKGKNGFLGIGCIHSKKRGHSNNCPFEKNPNPLDSSVSYWQTRCQELSRDSFIDYSSWSLSSNDEARIDGFLKGNSKAKVYFK